MPISSKPWGQFSEADYSPESFCRAALVDDNPAGQEKAKARCHLPILEPDGALNRNGVHAAAAALAGARGGVRISVEAKRRAARKLLARYRELEEEPPDSLRRLAG
jgi:hypothetical protein